MTFDFRFFLDVSLPARTNGFLPFFIFSSSFSFSSQLRLCVGFLIKYVIFKQLERAKQHLARQTTHEFARQSAADVEH